MGTMRDGRVNDQDDVDVEDFPLQGYEVSQADANEIKSTYLKGDGL